MRLAGIGTDRLGAEAMGAALLDEELHRADIRPRRMRAILAAIGVGVDVEQPLAGVRRGSLAHVLADILAGVLVHWSTPSSSVV